MNLQFVKEKLYRAGCTVAEAEKHARAIRRSLTADKGRKRSSTALPFLGGYVIARRTSHGIVLGSGYGEEIKL